VTERFAGIWCTSSLQMSVLIDRVGFSTGSSVSTTLSAAALDVMIASLVHFLEVDDQLGTHNGAFCRL